MRNHRHPPATTLSTVDLADNVTLYKPSARSLSERIHNLTENHI